MSDRVIRMTGEGSAAADPEYAVVECDVRADGDDPVAATAACAAIADRAVARMEGRAGVRDVHRPTVNVFQRTEHDPATGELRLRGWQASQPLRIRVDAGSASEVVSELVAVEVEVRHVSWHLDDDAAAAVASRARADAVADARVRAEDYAVACETALGRIVAVTDRATPDGGLMRAKFASGQGGIQLAPEPVEVSESVTVTWELAD